MESRLLGLISLLLISNVLGSGNEMRCPQGVVRFGAFPGNDPRSKHSFYQCKGGIAKIEQCQNNEIYNQHTERCVLSPPRTIRRRRETEVEKTNIELKRQGITSNIGLGYLYDARSERLLAPLNLWSQNDLGTNNCSNPACDSKFFRKYETQDSFSDIEEDFLFRLNKFHVEASLKMSFMGGLMSVSGSAKYLRHDKVEENMIRYVLGFEATTGIETIPYELEISHPELCEKVGKPNGPTHVVTSITRGFRAVLVFEKTTKDVVSNSETAGSLSLVVQAIPTFSIDGKGLVDLTEEEKTLAKSMSIKFFGDTILENPPATFDEAVKVYKELPTYAKVSRNVYSFTLTPIENYCDQKAGILNSLSANNIAQVEGMINSLKKLRQKIESLKQSQAAKIYRKSIGKTLNDFLVSLNKKNNEISQKLKEILPRIRGDSGAESELIDILTDFNDGPFKHETAETFMANRKKEIETIQNNIKDLGPNIVIDASNSGESNVCVANHEFAVIYILYVLPIDNIIDAYVNDSRNWEEGEQWFNNITEVGLSGVVKRKFIKFSEHNKDNQHCFMVTLKHVQDDEKSARILGLRNGLKVTDDFTPPPKLELPSEFEVTYDSITFSVNHTNAEHVKGIKAKIWKYLSETEEDAYIKEIPVGLDGSTLVSFGGREANTLYEISIQLSTDLGMGPPSDKLLLQTSPTSPPNNLRISSITDSQFTLNWEEPIYVSTNTTIRGYTVEVTDQSQTVVTRKEVVDGTETMIRNLRAATCYVTSVKSAHDTEIYQGKNEQIITITPESRETKIESCTRPHPPANLKTLQPGTNSITLSWNEVVSVAPGAHVQEYEVKYYIINPTTLEAENGLSPETILVQGSSITLNDLAAGVHYHFSVRVLTSLGNSEFGNGLIKQTQPLDPTMLDMINANSRQIDAINIQRNQTSQDLDALKLQLTALDSISLSQLPGNASNIIQRITALERKPKMTPIFVASKTTGGHIPYGTIKGFNEVAINDGNSFNSATGGFQVKKRGNYLCTMSGWIGSGKNAILQIRVNGSTKQEFYDDEDEGKQRTFSASAVLQFEVGDTVTISNAYQSTFYASSSLKLMFACFLLET